MDLPAADSDAWNIAEGGSSDSPSMIRYRPELSAFIGDTRFPRRLVIIWRFDGTATKGLPDEPCSDQLRDFEDALIAALDPDRVAILTFVFTSGGIREWHFYVSDIDEVGQRINAALADQPGLPIELSVEDDPEWAEFSTLLSQCKDESD